MTSDGRRTGDEWFGVNRLDENLFVQHHQVVGNEVPGWRLERSRTVQLPEGPDIRRTFWRASDKEATVLSVELIECASRQEAHRMLATLVGDYQSPEVARDERAPVGDVSFTVPGETAIVFARANVVVQVRNADGEVVPVTDIAAAVDVQIHRRPEVGGVVVPSIEVPVPRSTTLLPGGAVELTLKCANPLGGIVTLRYYSRLGQVAVVNGTTVYEAEQAGEERLVVVATNSAGGSAETSVDLIVNR
ncbi:MAG: hypothetical protein ACR2KK_09100 [Acidimicrobiales bacterium]